MKKQVRSEMIVLFVKEKIRSKRWDEDAHLATRPSIIDTSILGVFVRYPLPTPDKPTHSAGTGRV